MKDKVALTKDYFLIPTRESNPLRHNNCPSKAAPPYDKGAISLLKNVRGYKQCIYCHCTVDPMVWVTYQLWNK